jgi:type I restriction enzyme S subunit
MGYVQLYISSPLFTDAVERIVAGTAYNALTIVKIKSMMFPLPPLAEQHRIVAKVDELMRWCDELESRLTVAQTTATHLLDAALDRALRGEL